MRWLRENQAQYFPVTLVIAAGAFYRAIDTGTDSLAILTSVRAVTVLALVLGFVAVRRKGTLPTSSLWALMVVSAGMLLADTLILAVPESATISAGRQANRATAVANLVGYGVVVWLAVRVGSQSIWHAGLIVFGYAAMFAPTWPFLSPGMAEPTFFVARLILIGIAISVIGLITVGFRSFDQRTANQQRTLVIALIMISVLRIAVVASPAAFITPLAAADAMIFGIAGYGIANGLAMGVTWMAVWVKSSRAT